MIMKRTILFLAAFLVIISACEKDKNDDNENNNAFLRWWWSWQCFHCDVLFEDDGIFNADGDVVFAID